VRKAISNLININQLVFSNVEVSAQTTIAMIRAHTIASGANLSANYYTSPIASAQYVRKYLNTKSTTGKRVEE